jgi:hypothetical protein
MVSEPPRKRSLWAWSFDIFYKYRLDDHAVLFDADCVTVWCNVPIDSADARTLKKLGWKHMQKLDAEWWEFYQD